ncbi:MAG: DUF354 domain-containing protein [Candidatus Pacearchaeota archaeon]|nr:MAG: DUF354 domain-containing protein [Candidatus Pacearchaeota archaeon]
MKIWIDITNTPHVLFFKPIIEMLRKERHEVIITARKHAQTLGMLDFFHLPYVTIGKHAGKSLIKKAFNTIPRVSLLKKFIRKEKPDLGICHQSPYLVQACFLLGIKSIYIFDNETAALQNLLSIPFASKVLCLGAIKKKRLFGKKLIKYPGVKEAVYLTSWKFNKNIFRKLGLNKNKKIIVLRPEPYTAAYYKKNKDILLKLVKSMPKEWQVVLIARSEKQKKEYKKINPNLIIPKKAIDGPSLIYYADLVIGAGGTMNREAAVLGTPVISTYQEKSLAVDEWLIKKGLMIHSLDPSLSLIKKVMGRKKKSMLKEGKQALDLIIGEIEKTR